MQQAFWLERWQQQEIGFHQTEINPHLSCFWQALPTAEQPVTFVPLCGKSLDLQWLRTQSRQVIGVELSPIAVQAFFAENGLAPEIKQMGSFQAHCHADLTLLQGDFFELTPQHLQDVTHVYDRASLVALPPSMRQSYAQHLQLILPTTACILLIAFDYPQQQMDGPPFAVTTAEVQQLYQQHYALEILWQADILAENPRFQQRGLTHLQETVYCLKPLNS